MYTQFHFWQTVLDFELTIFQFVRSLQVSDFDLYVASQADLGTWYLRIRSLKLCSLVTGSCARYVILERQMSIRLL